MAVVPALLAVVLPAILLLAAAAGCALSLRLRSTSGARLAARRSESPLARDLSYWSIFDEQGIGTSVNVDGTYSIYFGLCGVDVECLDQAGRSRLSTALHSIVQNLPTGCLVQVLHWTDRELTEELEEFRSSATGAGAFSDLLVESKVQHAHKEELLGLVVSRPPASQPISGRLPLTRKIRTLSPSDHSEAIRQLGMIGDHVRHGLAEAGISARPLTAVEIRTLIYRLLHPRRFKIVPDPFAAGARATDRVWIDQQTAREQLVFAGIEEEKDRLALDGHLVRVLTIKELPTQTLTAMLDSLAVVFDFDCRVHFAVRVLDQGAALEALKSKRDRAQMLVGLRRKRNQEAEAQAEDLGDLIDQVLRSSLRIVEVAISVVLTVDQRAKNPDRLLERQTADVMRELNRLSSAQALIDEYAQLDEYLATLPGNASHGRRWLGCTSHNAVHLLPLSASWTGDAAPLVLMHNARGNLVGLDPFTSDLPNLNGFIAGTTGSGKSALTNAIVMSCLCADTRTVIIDRGGSYARSTELAEGDYFSPQVGDETCSINPFFSHTDISKADGSFDGQRMQFLLAIVECMVCDHDRPALRQAERAVVGSCLEETYRRCAATPLLENLIETFRTVSFADAEDTAIAHSMTRALRLWTQGPLARLFNRPSTIRLTEATRFATFDLKGIGDEPHLQSVVLLCISALIWNVVMQDQTGRKLIVFDEVWRLFETPASAKLIAELYRTARKYKASILTLSQSVQDFTSSPIADALLGNCATAYLLKHERGHREIAADLGLNERELAIFQQLKTCRGHYSEALICRGKDHHFRARITLTPLEYWISTTHSADLALEAEFRATRPHLSRLAVLLKLAELHPHGAPALERQKPDHREVAYAS